MRTPAHDRRLARGGSAGDGRCSVSATPAGLWASRAQGPCLGELCSPGGSSVTVLGNNDMAELLLGEAKLEQYLKEHPLRQGASPRGPRPQLTEVRKHLTAALDRGNLKSEFLQESSLVLAKLHYVEGDCEGALRLYARAGLEDWPLTGAPPYRLRMAAEAYATQGLCLEKLPISSSTSSLRVDREQDIITCYEKAGDIALLYLQEIERKRSSG